MMANKSVEQQFEPQKTKEILLRRLVVAIPLMTAFTVFIAYIILFYIFSYKLKDVGLGYVKQYYIESQKDERKSIIKNFQGLINDEINQAAKNTHAKNRKSARKSLKSLILNQINDTKYSKNGYIFAIAYNGITLANPKKSLIGKNNWNLTVGGEKIVQKLIKAARQNPSGAFVGYTGSSKPSTGLPAKKISYVAAIPKLKWIIGSGFYIDDINAFVVKEERIINGMIKDSLTKIAYFMIAIILLVFISSIFLSKILKDIFMKYSNNILRQNKLLEQKVRERTDKLNALNRKLRAANERANIMAVTDPLTLLFNRFHMDKQLNNEIDRFKRTNRSFALIFADIDNFKSINDKCGHGCGDFILVSIAQIMKKCLRKIDTISRWGGEEFLILLPDTDRTGAAAAAEKIRETVENTKFKYKENFYKITVTIGVSVYNDAQLSAINIINRADNAMYSGKLQGKNCVAHSQ